MRNAHLLAVLLAPGLLVACDKTVALELSLAPEAIGLAVDLSCARSIEVIALAEDDDESPTFSCIDFGPGGFRSPDDHDLGGALSMRSPASGVARVLLYLYSGSECLGVPLMIGGAALGGDDRTAVAMAPVASCDQRILTGRTVRTIDFFGVAERKACETPSVGPIAVGLLFGNRFDPSFPLEFLAGAGEQPTAGLITSSSVLRDAVLSGCPAVGSATSVACVYADAPGACPAAGDRGPAIEFAHISATDAALSLEPARVAEWSTAVLGIVVDASRNPIAGAQIQLRGDPGKVVYTQRTGKRLAPTNGAATDATGTFILYADGPRRVNVKVGSKTRALRLGGWLTESFTPIGSATVIVM